MTKAEVRAILETRLATYRDRPFEQLVALIDKPDTFEGPGYQVEVNVFWDSPERRQLRLRAAGSYSFWTSFVPTCVDDLIDAPRDR